MPLYTSIASLSQTPSSNAADGSVDAPSTIDQQTNLLASFIAKLRDGAGFTAGAITTALGYTPVIRGGIAGTDTNPVNLGWNASISKMVVASNGNNFSNQWPIDITGNATTATTATTATNANALGGWGVVEFMRRGSANTFGVRYVGARLVFNVDGNEFSGAPPMDITGNATTATTAASCSGNSATATTASNANTLGGISSSGFIQNGNNVTSIRSNTGSQLLANIGGTDSFWSCTPISDARVKKNIAPTVQDSLAKFAALEYVTYQLDASILPGSDERVHKVGVIAQQAKAIEPDWVIDDPALSQYMHMNTEQILMDAMYAIKQLKAEVDALKARA